MFTIIFFLHFYASSSKINSSGGFKFIGFGYYYSRKINIFKNILNINAMVLYESYQLQEFQNK